ncbi:MAG: aminoacyl-tRNA hydrolase, partial [Spirochaetales bacterium]|nr:aminoacyl-tRNA hydrolase [Spirochaetales bacterium]
TSDYTRIYIGIGRPQEGVSVVDHVLGRETETERKKILDSAVDDAAKAIVKLINGASVGDVQLEFNRKGIL